ncbi:Dimeric alpha-beta barrel [Penicillium cf. griseofulvum]|uniref:Dimeric alpha-beta barrel n=1 Tax=Penicillium cf. griseofulvum TaxID=2972120 RepID=A0A9W9JP33_9EURO|nr:Dimeric alpha-beta barrel [Penicillium cf. griseofulvum]KAJ5424078.1 Dimeric alpha-beta barrel [Penicillium cf. griseofulvum]KAJ5442682.1 Dimeric alpha-beta barrel [Penicillium cf. griseofulvum]
MTVTAVVLYPNNADIQFDETYYMKSHMPLAESIWKPHGLLNWRITKFPTALDGSRSEYLIMATIEWESQDAMKSALAAPGTAAVFDDIPNFTNAKPITLGGADLQK